MLAFRDFGVLGVWGPGVVGGTWERAERGGRAGYGVGYELESSVLGTPATCLAFPVKPGTGGAGVVGEGIREVRLGARRYDGCDWGSHGRSLTKVVGRGKSEKISSLMRAGRFLVRCSVNCEGRKVAGKCLRF